MEMNIQIDGIYQLLILHLIYKTFFLGEQGKVMYVERFNIYIIMLDMWMKMTLPDNEVLTICEFLLAEEFIYCCQLVSQIEDILTGNSSDISKRGFALY